jgi:hypothetical protein
MKTGSSRAPGDRWWRRIDGEPTLQELLDDPVIEAFLARDGVERDELVRLIFEVRDRLLRQRRPLRETAAASAD